MIAFGVVPHAAAQRAEERIFPCLSYVNPSMVGGRPLTFETGRLAKQAHGVVLVTYGESVVLVTAVSSDERPGLDFFPLTCEYVEKTYAAGKIPGGFFKREGRQRDDGDPHLRASWIARCARCSPTASEGHADHRDRAVVATRRTRPTCSR